MCCASRFCRQTRSLVSRPAPTRARIADGLLICHDNKNNRVRHHGPLRPDYPGGRYFDGSTAPSAIRSLAINDGRIVLISVEPLDTALAERIIDARGKWITPGFLDTHTHYDAELMVAPSLSESAIYAWAIAPT